MLKSLASITPTPRMIRYSLFLLTLLLIAAAGSLASLNLVQAQSANGVYDADGDRLIEISNLEQLDAVRYDLSDGNGRPDDDANARDYGRAFPTSSGESVCDRACQGYELTRSLDFNDPDSYAAGAVNPEWDGGDGWEPMGDNSNRLNTQFEGNGHTVSNLYIHRQDTDSVGLFGRVGASGVIGNLGVVNAEIAGRRYVGILAGWNGGEITGSHATGSVRGTSYYVGGLVGWNESGVITASYASGSASGDAHVGGLAGYNSRGAITASYATGSASASSGSVGGLVGSNVNGGAITESYATGDVSGGDSVGGLVGSNGYRSSITVSYATGDVSGTGLYVGGLVGDNSGPVVAAYATGGVSGGRQQAGGLVGRNNGGSITASYAIGSVSGGGSFVGGLVGRDTSNGDITDSYWNTDVFGEGEFGEGHTTAQLQSPTGYTGIYRDWNADLDNADRNDDDATGADDFWDFGSSSQYPALKADFNRDGTATAAEFGGQGRTAPVTPVPGPTVDLSLDNSQPLKIRIDSPVPVIATFAEAVSGFIADDITVDNGTVSNFAAATGGRVYTFDVTPSDIARVTVDIDAEVAMDADGNGNAAAPQLSFTPYDDDGVPGISRAEAIVAIRDYFGGKLTRAQAIAVIQLYFASGS